MFLPVCLLPGLIQEVSAVKRVALLGNKAGVANHARKFSSVADDACPPRRRHSPRS